MQGTRLRYVIKFVADMSEAVKFYRDVMGPIAAFSVTHLAADGLRL
jgi:catechol 2,3-dioxygenase-like lactoylglutathione lyase family enzyme